MTDKEQELIAQQFVESGQWRERLIEAVANNDWIELKELASNPFSADGVATLSQKEKGDWLLALVEIGSESMAREAFDAGLDPNAPVDEAKSSALMRAIEKNKTELIPLLMERCEQAAINFAGETAFGFACVSRPPDLGLIEALIPAALRPAVGEVDALEEREPPLAMIGLGCANIAIARKLIEKGALLTGTPFQSAFQWQWRVRAQRPNGGPYFKFVIAEMLRAAPETREEMEKQGRDLVERAQKSAIGTPAISSDLLTRSVDDLAAMGVYSEETEANLLFIAKSTGVAMPQLEAKKEREALSASVQEARETARKAELNEAGLEKSRLSEAKKSFRL